MQIFQGKAASQGIAMGPVVVWQKKNYITERRKITDVSTEVARLEAALEKTKEQLWTSQKLSTDILTENSASVGAIFQAQAMLVEDEGFIGQVREIIRAQQVNAEYAVQQIGRKFAEMFAAMEDAYMRERQADIQDITERVLQNLRGEGNAVPTPEEPAIIWAEDLTPGETLQFDRNKVLAFVTEKGSADSHAAILARSMGIPALVGVRPEEIVKAYGDTDLCEKPLINERMAMLGIVDTVKGQLILNPDNKIVKEYALKIQKERERRELFKIYKERESVTIDGHKIHICANIGRAAEVQDALENGAEGIGLFRSEFLYLGRMDVPSEEEQFEEYKQVLIRMADRRVIIRTLDIGADKQAGYFGLESEENPALGCRGIRLCLRRQDIFKTQFRALLRAAVYGNLAIMYPMITSVEEVEQIAQIVNQVTEELEDEGIPYRVPSQGIMIETPAAVMISDELAEKVDFFSIGTNDLTQYTLAMDRQNNNLDEFYNPHHKAILKMIQMVVENAHTAGKWVGICGELAADSALTESFVRMGVDELSVVPGKILELKKRVQEIKIQEV